MFASTSTDKDDGISEENESSQESFTNTSKGVDVLVESDDDEDLLAPSICFTGASDKAAKLVVLTPEKAVAPVGGSPLTPIQTYKPINNDVCKYRLAFDKLTADKSRRKERDAELAEMEALLQDGLKKERHGDTDDDTCSNGITDDGMEDDGRDLRECQLPSEMKNLIKEVQDFPEDLPGENIFPHFQAKSMPSSIPLELDDVPDKSFESTVVSMSGGQHLRMLLCGNWVLHHYMMKPCPEPVADWLFQVMCLHPEQAISNSAFQVLWALLGAAAEDTPSHPIGTRGILWVPSVERVVEMLTSLGANQCTLNPFKRNSPALMKQELSNTEEATKTSLENGIDLEKFPVCNVALLVQFLTHCLQKKPQSFTTEDLRLLMIILCRLSLDLRLQSSLFDIQMCIAATLDTFKGSQLKNEIRHLCRVIPQLSEHHCNLLHLAQIQPPSSQGMLLQRLLSLVLLHKFITRFLLPENGDETIKQSTVQEDSLELPDDVKLSMLVSLVDQIQLQGHSDYFLLHTIIHLLDLAVGNEDLPWSEKSNMEKLFNKLRKINGDIKDPRAVFMNRTKVKDIIVRTLGKFKFLINSMKPTKESKITGFFEYSTSDFQIETLKEMAVKEQEFSSGSSTPEPELGMTEDVENNGMDTSGTRM